MDLRNHHIVLLILNYFSLLATPQRIFIDQVPAYADLPICAVVPVSSIVRGMTSGCGDGGAMTSFSCFCSKSSSKFASMIATDVRSKCTSTGSESVTSAALEVFDSYCHMTEAATGKEELFSYGVAAYRVGA
ncbi:uncharacterized protein K452DRAFT_301131 [Aplosporella prunicola CBS 121167]|uniref:Extracellular membrane protein CFEM domain-containing protein n=1 Tax=Aplosporella prunicola CBS 121167 TaxID=1176127 RepID=A0A6A6B4P3_9PEZI|nr:uncharacterized protein K452DRAFT_301131 [Aplosporella prunicola CBS 121167]KAF2138608.1 hypothetical protein K452DRAFT_301131 [Aplosporella prunicola CBS 121167]